MLVFGKYRDDHEKQGDLLADFSESTLDFYQIFFMERAFEGEMEFLPPNCRAAVYIYKALKWQENDTDKAIAYYEQAMKVFPPWTAHYIYIVMH